MGNSGYPQFNSEVKDRQQRIPAEKITAEDMEMGGDKNGRVKRDLGKL